MSTSRQQWRSKLGFILAASGSAIGLGNIVFFSANAYKFGAGAFYLPYLIALLVVGLPVMLLEFGLGQSQQRAFPQALGAIGGKAGEFAGWWALINALLITMYYVAILGWVLGMWWKALVGDLWTAKATLAGFAMKELANPKGSFFQLISSWGNVGFVALVWLFNIFLVLWGTRSIEAGVKIMMPLMWLFMLVLVVRGLTLPGGLDGVYLLFTPEFSVIKSPKVWQGAFSQIFFTLSLGFGVMTAYASYLPKKSDHTTNALIVSSMNCSFELIAGLAVFSLLFTFALTPKASTLAMMFFVVPSGIMKLPVAAKAFGVLFFTLLLMAGLSSSISLIEALAAALLDKFKWRRTPTVLAISLLGILGSLACALPKIIDPGLDSNGTFGFTFLDLLDHYAFGFGLLIVGLLECLIIGWMMPVSKLRETLNAHSRLTIGTWFDVLVKYVIPLILTGLIVMGVIGEFQRGGFYGHDYKLGGFAKLPVAIFVFWLSATILGSLALTHKNPAPDPKAPTS